MKQIFILFLLWFGLSLSAQDRISLLFVGDLMQHQAQIVMQPGKETGIIIMIASVM